MAALVVIGAVGFLFGGFYGAAAAIVLVVGGALVFSLACGGGLWLFLTLNEPRVAEPPRSGRFSKWRRIGFWVALAVLFLFALGGEYGLW